MLVVDYSFNWAPLFKAVGWRCEQCSWQCMDLSFEKGVLVVRLEPEANPLPWTAQGQHRTLLTPTAVLVRNFPTDLRGHSYRNQLLCLMLAASAGLICLNNPTSLLASIDRAWLYSSLLMLSQSLGPQVFPLVELDFYPNTKGSGKGMMHGEFRQKSVFKVGSCNAGFGKFLCENAKTYDDLWSVLATGQDYVTEEAFIEHEFEYRVQVIGDHIRCFKRNSDSSWKNNTGLVSFSPFETEPKHLVWRDACSKLFGGLDIFALDVLRRADGSDVIIEINPSANGLWWEYEEEDAVRIRDLVIKKANQVYPTNH